MYSFGARVNTETGKTEEFSETLARVGIELGEKNWAAEVDLAEGKVEYFKGGIEKEGTQ